MTFQYKVSDEDDDDIKPTLFPLLKKKLFHTFDQTFTMHQVHFYLSDEIGEPAEYVEMIHRIKTAGPGDMIFIHLNTPGGRLDTGIQIINAMRASQAKIVTVFDSMAYSLGTLIFLAGDEYIVHDHAMMMIHNWRGATVGKGNEQVAQLEATVKWFASLAKKIYVPFLTDEELAGVLEGKDMWMQSPEIRKRLDRMVAQKEAEPKKKGRKKSVPDEEEE